MCGSESRQMNEGIDTGVPAVHDGRFKQACGPVPDAVQHLMEFFQAVRIEYQLRVSTVDGAVRASPLIPNKTFRPRHRLLLFSKPLGKRHKGEPRVTNAKTTTLRLPVAGRLFVCPV